MPSRTAPVPVVTEAQILAQNWDRKPTPAYSVHEVAKLAFGMSSSWLRLKLSDKQPGRPETSFVGADGRRMSFRRKDPANPMSARVFLLSDIEPMARSLHSFGDIDDDRLALILEFVIHQASLFDLSGPGKS